MAWYISFIKGFAENWHLSSGGALIVLDRTIELEQFLQAKELSNGGVCKGDD